MWSLSLSYFSLVVYVATPLAKPPNLILIDGKEKKEEVIETGIRRLGQERREKKGIF